jgi:LmbE family N-acetylglucosaminyl deacetylase
VAYENHHFRPVFIMIRDRLRERLFIPDGMVPAEALPRVTHLGIGAHQDDLEFMAFHGILECFGRDDRWFGGVTCTDGAGSPRGGLYAGCSSGQMTALRHAEQETAAVIGGYAAMFQLGYPSGVVRNAAETALRDDLLEILTSTRPQVVYTHNPADKHETHVAVTLAALHAMRAMPRDLRPGKVIGCEVWRGLDWLPDESKVLMDVSGRDHLAAALNGVFDSQIAGGKRYDLAILGRRAANATFLDSHSGDQADRLIYGLDLTPLVLDETLDIADYVCGFIDAFKADVRSKLAATGLGGA